MSEPTIAEVLSKYPNIRKFISDDQDVVSVYIDQGGDVMLEEEDGEFLLDSTGIKYIRLKNLRPKPKKLIGSQWLKNKDAT